MVDASFVVRVSERDSARPTRGAPCKRASIVFETVFLYFSLARRIVSEIASASHLLYLTS